MKTTWTKFLLMPTLGFKPTSSGSCNLRLSTELSRPYKLSCRYYTKFVLKPSGNSKIACGYETFVTNNC